MKKHIAVSQPNSRKIKRGVLSLIFTAVAVAAVILFNIAASSLAKKATLSVDLSASHDFTLSEDVKSFLDKDVTRDVTLTLCSTKTDYTDGLYPQLLTSYNYGDISNGVFLKQTIFLLEEIAKSSDHITLKYADPQDPAFSAYTSKYKDLGFTMGDILVESKYVNGSGETVERHKLLDIKDIYNVVDVAKYYGENYVYEYGCYYRLEGNLVETAVCSAIYSTTSDKTYKVAVITANGGTYVDNLDSFMSKNNYEFTNVTDLYEKDAIPADSDIIIIAAPKNDYKLDELEIIDNFISSNDSQYRTVLYIASSEQAELPNLNEFLNEWGYVVEPGYILSETDSNYIRGGSDTCIQFQQTAMSDDEIDETEYFSSLSPTVEYDFIARNNAVITAKPVVSNSRHVRTLINSSEGSAAKPLEADDNWKPDSGSTSSHVGLAVSSTYDYIDETFTYMYKRVLVLSSMDFITTDFNSYSECGNLNLIMSALDASCGKNIGTIVFDTRTFNTETFEAPTDKSVTVMMWIFVITIPLLILICCIVITVRRRHL